MVTYSTVNQKSYAILIDSIGNPSDRPTDRPLYLLSELRGVFVVEFVKRFDVVTRKGDGDEKHVLLPPFHQSFHHVVSRWT